MFSTVCCLSQAWWHRLRKEEYNKFKASLRYKVRSNSGKGKETFSMCFFIKMSQVSYWMVLSLSSPPRPDPTHTSCYPLHSNATMLSAFLLGRIHRVSGLDGWLQTTICTVKSLTWIKTVPWLSPWEMKEAGSMKGKEGGSQKASSSLA